MSFILQEPRKLKKLEHATGRRPTGMNREVYALLYSDKDRYVCSGMCVW